jgi:hypothetical protein
MNDRLGAVAVAGLAVGVMAFACNAFDVSLSPVYEVSGQPPSPARTSVVRAHTAHAAVVVVLVGLVATVATRSVWPVTAAGAAAGWLAWQYDTAARRTPPPA